MKFLKKLNLFNPSPMNTYAADLKVINGYKEEVEKLSAEDIRKEVSELQEEFKGLKTDEEVFKKIKEVRLRMFALTREAAKRSIGQFHYDVQLVGGLVLSEGKIAEMKTGEGKTLTATLPLALFALAGKGSHIVTVNDYLSRWQASLMGHIFHYLGLSVASIQHEASFVYDPGYEPEAEEVAAMEQATEGLVLDVKHMRKVSRQQAYAADITYGTNNEFGFDYLRDNMAPHKDRLVQRDLFFVIVDEVDSILIDEARTPLIISMPDSEPTSKYFEFAKLVDKLSPETDFEVDEKRKAATLTDEGITKIEKILNVQNIYDTSKGVTTLHHIEQALKAKSLFLKDRDYVVREGEIIIVDEFTGRLMFGRRYSEGLHQAIEAKENVTVQQESKTLATITFQNLFRLYSRLSGMTGTAKTEEEEFFKIYKLHIVSIPTHRPLVREDLSDMVYKTEDEKFKAIAREVFDRSQKGQPVLIGTVSIAKNEILSEYLKKAGVRFEILNAKNHEREASIIAQAGRFGQVTLATNIAGRGVDILLGGNPVDVDEAKSVREAGGLYVLGTERHESRRIDNQLRGRAGRQGDPGRTQFYVSMEDDLMRLFGGERMKNMMTRLGLPDDQPLEAKLVSRSIEQAQKKIEGLNFDTRKHVLEFDDVLNYQRVLIYKRRRKYLVGHAENEEDAKPFSEETLDTLHSQLSDIVEFGFAVEEDKDKGLEAVFAEASRIIPLTDERKKRVYEEISNAADREFAVFDSLFKLVKEEFTDREEKLGKEVFEEMQRFVVLQAVDSLWMEHLDMMDHLRDSVRLRGYGQRDPLVEYKREGFEAFKNLQKEINKQIAYTLFKVGVHIEQTPSVPVNVVTSTGGVTSLTDNQDPKFENVKRNDPCPCGSGKKFKKCHGK
jgi:preprotein translocase subunit SecA